MEWLNYHHLFYFWTVAREGGVSRAAEKLRVAQPTISAQVRALEDSLGQKLFSRRGRGLVLTESGRTVLGYADEIFTTGRELLSAVRHASGAGALRLAVGVTDAVPKLVAHDVLRPALAMETPVRIAVREGKLDALATDLAMHRLDLVIADQPYQATLAVRLFQHRLGECGVSFLAAPGLAKSLKKGFPASLDGAPALLPTDNTALRGSLEAWLESRHVRPRVVAEFEDTALMKMFGAEGHGFFVLPSVAAANAASSLGCRIFGTAEDCHERFFVLSAERRLKHPVVVEITRAARSDLFTGHTA